MSVNDYVDVDALKTVLMVKKRNFTRFYNSCGKATKFATNHPTPDAANSVKETQLRLAKAYGELMQVIDTLECCMFCRQN